MLCLLGLWFDGGSARRFNAAPLAPKPSLSLPRFGGHSRSIRELGGWSEKGGLNLVQRYAHVGEGLKRDAVEALARGSAWCVLIPGLIPSRVRLRKRRWQLLANYARLRWCRRGDSNPHTLAGTRP